ncbi:MAG: hypothetical protein ACD_45C00473G0021 [uncultured bacterium]|nr:MAG: hypothetical protein ACD_45C00473G0021 [uncultured bacterium]
MLLVAIVFFIFAALLGLAILTKIFKHKSTYKPVVFIHGTLASIALINLAVYVALGHKDLLLIVSFVFFVLTAIGGFTLFTFDINDKQIPKMLAVLHPIGGIISLTLLILYVVHRVS